MAQQTDQFGRIHEIGFDASGQPASSGFYVVAPDGRIVLVQSMKPGWRIATQAEMTACAAQNAARQAEEAKVAATQLETDRAASATRRELERAAGGENAQRVALKAAAKPTPTVLAHAEPPVVSAHEPPPLPPVEPVGHNIVTAPIASSSSPPALRKETTGGEG